MKAPAYFPSPSWSNQFSIETLMPRVCTQWGPRCQTAQVLGWTAVAPSCPNAEPLGRGWGDVLVYAEQVLGVIPTLHRGETLIVGAIARLHARGAFRSEEHTSELQSLMRISYAVFCLKKKNTIITSHT